MKEEFTRFISKLAEESAQVIRPYFNALELEVELKADETPVTQADRRAEAVMRERIRTVYPTHGVIGEEYGKENEDAEFVWVLDPIDGTISFASGCPLFGTLIGLLHHGKPFLGAIHLPILERLCLGDNHQTTLNGQRVQMREVGQLSAATFLATDIQYVEKYQNRERFEKLLRRIKVFRTWGDCFGYSLLAIGRADIMVDPIMNPWDVLPLIPVIQGANGVITTWQGGDAASGNSCVAANKALHQQVLDILNS